MADPITPAAAATLAATGVAVPVLTLFGISFGLRPDELLAGLCGAIAAITLLNTVPSTGDSWQALLRTTGIRVGVAVGSAVTSGYLTPLLAFLINVPEGVVLGLAFAIGAGAQAILKGVIQGIVSRVSGGNK